MQTLEPNEIVQLIIQHLKHTKLRNGCDLSDVGNEIGIALGRVVDKNKIGYEIESLIAGIKHGVSLIDGTH